MPGTNDNYDFILVGAGTASCLIASRLSQQLPKHRILVLEAGQHLQNDPRILTPGLSAKLQGDPTYDWQYRTAPEPGLNGRSLKHPRGKLVGGTSAINSHSVVFPNTEWQDRVARELLPDSSDWNAQGMKECYARWQNESSGFGSGAGFKEGDHDDGVLRDRVQTSYPRKLDLLQTTWIRVFEDLGLAPGTTGFAESRAEALTITNAVDASKAERSHAATALLEPAMARGNVELRTGVKVERIVFEDSSAAGGKLVATGIAYTQRGVEHVINGREVILCAGVFESPALLERSGIGAEKILEASKIPVLYELPGVGENLQDHLNCSLSFETQDHIHTRDQAAWNPDEPKAALAEYQQHRSGRMSEGPAHSFAFTPLQMLETPKETQEFIEMVRQLVDKESNPSLRAQYSVIQKTIESPNEATATTLMIRMQRHTDGDSLPADSPRFVNGNFVTVIAMLAHPFSRGSCHLSTDSSQPLEIKFNYLCHPLDTEILARHLRLVERLFQQPAFVAIAKPEGRRLPRSFPHPIASLEDAREMLPINGATNYHPCGTCSMMREDLGGVVDEQLRVYGTKNLRVCDASILPIIPRGNILTAVYAFAEKAVEIICGEVDATAAASS